jgi:DNA-binding CsgD family transcriptional regulator
MLKHGRGSSEDTKKTAFTLLSMQQVTQVLAGGRGGTILTLATHESRATGLHPPTVPAVQGVLQQLSQQEEQIVRLRYGIGEHVHSIDEISRRLGIMPRQVEHIELRAFRRLREASVVPERSDRPATPPAPCGRGGHPPLPPSEPQPSPDDFDCEANPWDEV